MGRDKRRGKRVLLLILGAAMPVLAMDWPAPEEDIIANFGANDQGYPVLGDVFQYPGEVRAADGGELLFRRREGDVASRLPSPLGAWVALDHGDGLISIYSRFKEGDDGTGEAPLTIGRGEPLAMSGVSGWSEDEGFYFLLFDRKERHWVNPGMIVYNLPDTRPPVIQSVKLTNSEGESIDPALRRAIKQDRYTVSVTAWDTRSSPDDHPLAPYRIISSMNGAEMGGLNLETFSARDGSLVIYRNGLIPVKQVYAALPGFEVGEVFLTRGQVSLEIIVQDLALNSRSVLYRLGVE